VVDGLKVLDPERPIREADKRGRNWIVRFVPEADIPSSLFAKPAGQCNRRQKSPAWELGFLFGESATWISG
jgi:hypothetical protein